MSREIDFIMGMRGDGKGGIPLEQALSRRTPLDGPPEESLEELQERKALAYLSMGYRPGATQAAAMRMGEIQDQLEEEREKLERSERRQRQLHAMHAAGKIDAMTLIRMSGDADEGDPGRVAQLQGQLQRMQAETSEMLSRTQLPEEMQNIDPGTRMQREAHRIFREATRARMAAAERGEYRRQEPRPFASRASVSPDEDCSGPDCRVCNWARAEDALRTADTGYQPGREVTRYAPDAFAGIR